MKLLSLLIALITMSTTALTPIYDVTANDINGKPVKLSEYKGKVLLIVNVASYCGYTKHYEPLEAMYKKYKAQGLEILGFPTNDFGEQEPGTNDEIKSFCSTKFGVTFPMFSKVTTKGENTHPLYAFLEAGGGNPALAGEIPWNFEKFLIDRHGNVVERFKFKIDPESEEFVSRVEKELAK